MAGFAPVPAGDAALVLWHRLRSRIAESVADYNSEAGEIIWTVCDGSSDPCGFVVCGRPGDSPRVRLSLDTGTGRLACAFEKPAPEDWWEYTVLPDGATMLRLAVPRRLEDAAREILDHLVRGGISDDRRGS